MNYYSQVAKLLNLSIPTSKVFIYRKSLKGNYKLHFVVHIISEIRSSVIKLLPYYKLLFLQDYHNVNIKYLHVKHEYASFTEQYTHYVI